MGMRRLKAIGALSVLATIAASLVVPIAGEGTPSGNQLPGADVILAKALAPPVEQDLAFHGTMQVSRPNVELASVDFHLQTHRDDSCVRLSIRATQNGTGRIETAEVTRWADGRIVLTASAPVGPDHAATDGGLTRRIGGSDLTLLDLLIPYLRWHSAEVLRRDRLLGRSCYVVTVSPPDDVDAGLHRLVLWVDAQYSGILQVEARDGAGNVLRRLVMKAYSLKERTVTRFRVESPSSGSKTKVDMAKESAGEGAP